MKIFVTDFDGTLAERDFYSEVLMQLMPRGMPNYYTAYLRGEMTHFECLAKYFSQIQASEADVLQLVDQLTLPRNLPSLLAELNEAGWEVVVASAGCRWYIDRLLSNAGVQLTVHANDGFWQGNGQGLQMRLPTHSPFFSPTVGIDKPAVVRDALARAEVVAFAGDGHTDVPAALLVPEAYRFATSDCAEELRQLGQTYRPFQRWEDVVRMLLG